MCFTPDKFSFGKREKEGNVVASLTDDNVAGGNSGKRNSGINMDYIRIK